MRKIIIFILLLTSYTCYADSYDLIDRKWYPLFKETDDLAFVYYGDKNSLNRESSKWSYIFKEQMIKSQYYLIGKRTCLSKKEFIYIEDTSIKMCNKEKCIQTPDDKAGPFERGTLIFMLCNKMLQL